MGKLNNINIYKYMKNITNFIYEALKNINKDNLPDIFYHATPSCYLSSIKKNGLGGKMPKKLWWDYTGTEYENRNQGVFLATDDVVAYSFFDGSDEFEEFAEEYEERYDKELKILVFSVQTKDLDISKLKIDSNLDDDNPTYFYDGVIPFNKLSKVDTSDYE